MMNKKKNIEPYDNAVVIAAPSAPKSGISRTHPNKVVNKPIAAEMLLIF